jgi:hypothetical protein
VRGSKQVVHWISETWWEWSEIAGSPQGFLPAADSVCCEAGRETYSKHETGTEELCDQVDLGLHIVGAKPSEAPTNGRRSAGLHIVITKPSEAPTEGRQSQWSDHIGVTNVARQR